MVRRDQSTPGCIPWMHLPTSNQIRSKNHHRRSHPHRIASCFPYNLRYMYLNWFPRPRASLPIGLARRIHAHRRVLGYFNYPDPLCVHSKQNSSHWPRLFESTVTVTTPCISLTSCPPHCNHRPPPIHPPQHYHSNFAWLSRTRIHEFRTRYLVLFLVSFIIVSCFCWAWFIHDD